ncbi:MAG: hypothetical protein H6626_01590 [Pseudobdellovibrionaceae bacterium]|nr:hypothetical protein [Bdellovibrionales bacterium]USN47811.1 MAG: hypothetical protein H6626_01590 [Pseudobdellovibrionaceae bacterium]
MFVHPAKEIEGLLIPKKTHQANTATYYVLATRDDEEYSLLPNPTWDPVLHHFEWSHVCILGDLDPQRKLMRVKGVGPLEAEPAEVSVAPAYEEGARRFLWSWLTQIRSVLA